MLLLFSLPLHSPVVFDFYLSVPPLSFNERGWVLEERGNKCLWSVHSLEPEIM